MKKLITYRNPGKTEKWFDVINNRPDHFFALTASLVTVSAIFQDFLFSEINNTGFYIGEVLLFKIFWLFFIPFSYITFFLHRRILVKSGFRILFLMSIIVLLLIMHLIGSSVLISGFANTWFGFRITVSELITSKLIDYLGVAFLFYLSAMWLAEYTYQVKEKIEGNQKLARKKQIKIITIREGKKVMPIEVSKIQWINSDKPYVSIHTEDKSYLYSSTLKKILDEINNPNFVRIHRSTIVNTSKIEKLVSRLNGDYDVMMKGGKKLRLSRTYKSELKTKFFQFTS